jgi:hypothetical protein
VPTGVNFTNPAAILPNWSKFTKVTPIIEICRKFAKVAPIAEIWHRFYKYCLNFTRKWPWFGHLRDVRFADILDSICD